MCKGNKDIVTTNNEELKELQQLLFSIVMYKALKERKNMKDEMFKILTEEIETNRNQ